MDLRKVVTACLGATLTLAACQGAGPPPATAASRTEHASVGVMRPRYFPSFSKWDTDRDGKVTQKEFDDALQRNSMAAGWDEDGDGQLSDMEFATGFYWTWDLDGDGSVDRREYDSGCGAFFPSSDTYGTFDQYDADGDGRLSLDEFAALTSKVYPKWDRDGNRKLTERELQAAWYHTWDVNADGLLEHSEYRWN